MSVSYHPWFNVKIQHHYFAGAQSPVSCTPTPATRSIFQQNNISIKPSKDGFSVFFESSGPATQELIAKFENLGNLSFQVQANDPLFFNYTDIPFLHKEQLFLFHNIPNNPALQIKTISPEKQVNVNGIGILQINAGDLDNQNLTLTFDARKAWWQYSFIIDNYGATEFNNMEVFGPTNEKFFGPSQEIYHTGQQTQIFTSQIPLPLAQHFTAHAKLIFGNKQRMELKLPNVGAETLEIFSEGELKGEFFCRSYLHI